MELLNCRIAIGQGALAELGAFMDEWRQMGRAFFLLTDVNTRQLCLPYLERFLDVNFPVYSIPPGEDSKCISLAEELCCWLSGHNAGRQDIIINLGGGVVTDLGGFVASIFKRGVGYVNIPTSIIAQADAAIGGKTAVNAAGVKNIAGTFHHPQAVIIDPGFLDTLPPEHIRSGFAEILKMALLAGNRDWQRISALTPDRVADWMPLISLSVKTKASIVEQDDRDQGLRKILNLGHTLGHAFEALAGEKYPPGLMHGDAIAAGLIGELYISWRMGRLERAIFEHIEGILKGLFPKPPLRPQDMEHIMQLVFQDKKNNRDEVRLVILEDYGRASWDVGCGPDLLTDAIAHVLNEGWK